VELREGKDMPAFARPTASRIALTTSREPTVEMIHDSLARESRIAKALKEHERTLQTERLTNPERFVVSRTGTTSALAGGATARAPGAVTVRALPGEDATTVRLRASKSLAASGFAAMSSPGGSSAAGGGKEGSRSPSPSLRSASPSARAPLDTAHAGAGAGSGAGPASSPPSPTRARAAAAGADNGPGADQASAALGPTKALELLSAAVLEALSGSPTLRAFDTARPPALSFAALVASKSGVIADEQIVTVCRGLARVLPPLAEAVILSPRGFADLATCTLPLLTALPATAPAFDAVVQLLCSLARQITDSAAASSARTDRSSGGTAGGVGGGAGNQLTARGEAKLAAALPTVHSALVATALAHASKASGAHAAAIQLFSDLMLPQLLAAASRNPAKRGPLMRVAAAFCLPPQDVTGAAAAHAAAGPSGPFGGGGSAGPDGVVAEGEEPWSRDAMALIARVSEELAEDAEAAVVCVAALASHIGASPEAPLADLLVHQAVQALSCPAPNARAASLSILRRLLRSYTARVLALLPRLAELGEDGWWEVRLQLVLLLADALRILLSAGSSGGRPRTPGFLRSAAAALGVAPEDAAAVTALCEEGLAGVVAADPPAAVLHAFVGGVAPLLRACPVLLAPFADALARLPRDTRLGLLGLVPLPLLRPEGAAAATRIRSGIGATYAFEDALPPLPGLSLMRSVAGSVARAGLQQLEIGSFDVLLACCAYTEDAVGSRGHGGGASRGGVGGAGRLPPEYLDALAPLQDHIFVGLCDPVCSVAAAELLRHAVTAIPGGVSLLSAPMLLGSFALILQPPGGGERDSAAEARAVELLEDLAARGPPFDRAVFDAMTAFAARYAPLYAGSGFARVLASPALARFVPAGAV
jgi:hypothetical protein